MEPEEDEIGMVLARASELKAKFFNLCVHRPTTAITQRTDQQEEEEEEAAAAQEGLADIRDALDALEQHLSNLQTLQQQQRYDREASLFQIDCSRKILVSKLKEYKGDDLEVIHEASTFAGGNSKTLGHDEDLLLPPYPTHLPPDLFVMDGLYPSSRCSNIAKDKLLTQNGTKERQQQQNSCQPPSGSNQGRNKPQGRARLIFGFIAKSVLTFVGVASVMSLAGFKPMMLRTDSAQFKIQELLRRLGAGGKDTIGKEQCPSGKVMVIEEGQPRCLVKERVEVPFDLDVAAPKINYGFG